MAQVARLLLVLATINSESGPAAARAAASATPATPTSASTIADGDMRRGVSRRSSSAEKKRAFGKLRNCRFILFQVDRDMTSYRQGREAVGEQSFCNEAFNLSWISVAFATNTDRECERVMDDLAIRACQCFLCHDDFYGLAAKPCRCCCLHMLRIAEHMTVRWFIEGVTEAYIAGGSDRSMAIW